MAYTITEDDQRKYSRRGTILIPPITDSALIFPLDQDTKKFDKSFYSPALTDGRFSSEQITNVLTEIEETYKKKLSTLQSSKIYIFTGFLVAFCTLMLFTTAVLSDLGNCNDNDYENVHPKKQKNLRHSRNSSSDYNDDLEFEEDLAMLCGAWIFFFLGIIFWSIVLSIYSSFSQKKAREGVQATVNRNNQLFANYGLRWNLPRHFPHYIELWKDYRELNWNQIPIQSAQTYLAVPPSNQVLSPIRKCVQTHEQSPFHPSLNQVTGQGGYLGLQSNIISKPLVNDQSFIQANNGYTPPYSVMFNNN